MPDPVSPEDPRPPEARALDLARKMVALAREQRDALQRAGANSQFDWLRLRRDEVTAALQASSPGLYLDGEARDEVERLRQELLALDADMEAGLLERMSQVQHARAEVRRSTRAARSYLTPGPRRPSFIDQKR